MQCMQRNPVGARTDRQTGFGAIQRHQRYPLCTREPGHRTLYDCHTTGHRLPKLPAAAATAQSLGAVVSAPRQLHCMAGRKQITSLSLGSLVPLPWKRPASPAVEEDGSLRMGCAVDSARLSSLSDEETDRVPSRFGCVVYVVHTVAATRP